MKTVQKILFSIVLILTLIGCAPTDSAPDAAVPTATLFPTTTPLPSPTAAPVEDVLPTVDVTGQTITIWYVWNRGEADPFLEMITRFNEENTTGLNAVSENYYSYDALNAALLEELNFSPDQLPNIVLGYPYQYLAWHAFGDRLVDLSPYLADAETGAVDLIAQLQPAFQSQDQYGAQRLGIPAWRTAQVIIYNQTWAQELGFNTAPATLTTFMEQACAAAAANGDGTGGWIQDFTPATLLAWLAGSEGTLVTPEGKYAMNTPEMHTVFDFLYQLEEQGCAWQPDTFYPEDAFATRQTLFYAASFSSLPYLQAAIAETGSTDDWELIPFAGGDGQATLSVYGPSWMILDTHAAGNLAGWYFLTDWLSPTTQETWIGASGYLSLYATEYAPIQPEPNLQSWGTVRWALSDAAQHMRTFGFEAIDIPRLLDQLQATAEELQAK